MNVLLAPHNDDETIFAGFLCQLYRPLVVVCLLSEVQFDRYGISAADRQAETTAALSELGLEAWSQLEVGDRKPNWPAVRRELAKLQEVETVLAPAFEHGGHDHHNEVARIAAEVAWDRGAKLVSYTTYTRWGGRSRQGEEVRPEPVWVARKHRALACYETQIAEPSCASWFLDDLREYVL